MIADDSLSNSAKQLHFYKFRAPGKFTDDIIVNNRVYLASPDSFNDPFDCKTPISFEGTTADFKTRWIEVARKIEPKTPLPHLRRRADLMFRDPSLKILAMNEMPRLHAARVTKYGVFCMTERCDSILMWSHYADSHRGICLEFDQSLLLAMGHREITIELGQRLLAPLNPQKVHYSNKFPDLNYFRSSLEEISKGVVLWKSAEWSYESEWRICSVEVEDRQLPLPDGALTGIIFGCACSDETIAHYTHLAQSRRRPLALYKAIKREGAFFLNIVPHFVR